jgi:hypothetical protein
VLSVYTGEVLTNLTVIAANDDLPGGGSASSVTFSAMAGTTYRIAVDGFEGASGNVQLNLDEIATSQLSRKWTQAPGLRTVTMPNQGAAGCWFLIQTSTNLTDWTTLSTNQIGAGTMNLVLPTDFTSPARFYRAIPTR